MILYCRAYLRRKPDFFKSYYGRQKNITQNKLLRFHATASVKHELFEKI